MGLITSGLGTLKWFPQTRETLLYDTQDYCNLRLTKFKVENIK